MIGALKCCGAGARALRTTHQIGHGIAASSSDRFPPGGNINSTVGRFPCCGSLNWSQKRFLRGNAINSSENKCNNAKFVIKEIEDQISRNASVNKQEANVSRSQHSNNSKQAEIRKYRRSLRGHQFALLTSSSNFKKSSGQHLLVNEVSKMIVEDSQANVRVKNRKEETLLQEWISIQRELRTIKYERMVDYRKKLQIAGEEALKEMEANLNKGMNLDDLDQAIEGALCSQAKAEYSQQKTSNDN